MESCREALFGPVAGVDLLQSIGVNAQNFGIAVIGGTRCQTKLVFVVKTPTGDPIFVLAQKCALSGRNLDFVEIVPSFVAIVQPDVYRVRVTLWNCIYKSAHTFCVGNIARRRSLSACGGLVRRIDGMDIKILVTGRILNKQNELAVTTPRISGDRTLRVRRHEPCRGKRFLRFLDPDVSRLVPRLHERDVFSVRRDLRAGNLRIVKQQLAINQGRLLGKQDAC